MNNRLCVEPPEGFAVNGRGFPAKGTTDDHVRGRKVTAVNVTGAPVTVTGRVTWYGAARGIPTVIVRPDDETPGSGDLVRLTEAGGWAIVCWHPVDPAVTHREADRIGSRFD